MFWAVACKHNPKSDLNCYILGGIKSELSNPPVATAIIAVKQEVLFCCARREKWKSR